MDTVDKETRSRIMSSIRGRDTKPELAYMRTLDNFGVDYEYQPSIYGKPDFLIDGRRCVFIDGCFWHGCRRHFKRPKTNKRFWDAKIEGNKKRKHQVNRRLRAMGYTVVRYWEHDIVA